jgi:5'-nucleotidase/UDP-sugar diphosphatase
VLREIRGEVGEVLLLDSGDVLSGLKRLEKDEVVLRIYGFLKYDAVAIGDQEFANGWAFLAERVLTSGLPWLSACLKDAETGKRVAPPYIVKTLSGVRVAVIGLIGPDAFEFMEPDETESLTIADPVEMMKFYLPELRRLADVVVALSHLGDEEDMTLAERVPGIDVIVGGHTQVLLKEPLKVGETFIVQAGPDGEYVGRLDLKVDPKGRIVETRNQMIPLDSHVPDDSEIAWLVEAYFSGRIEKSRSHAE